MVACLMSCFVWVFCACAGGLVPVASWLSPGMASSKVFFCRTGLLRRYVKELVSASIASSCSWRAKISWSWCVGTYGVVVSRRNGSSWQTKKWCGLSWFPMFQYVCVSWENCLRVLVTHAYLSCTYSMTCSCVSTCGVPCLACQLGAASCR